MSRRLQWRSSRFWTMFWSLRINHLKRLSKIINDIYDNTLIYFSTLFLIKTVVVILLILKKNKNAQPRLKLTPFERPIRSSVLYPLSYWGHWWKLLKINYINLVLISAWPENITIIVYYRNIIINQIFLTISKILSHRNIRCFMHKYKIFIFMVFMLNQNNMFFSVNTNYRWHYAVHMLKGANLG